LLTSHLLADEPFFRERIESILRQHCYQCHSHQSDGIQGGLALDARSGWEVVGDSGQAVVPQKPSESLLLDAIRHGTREVPPGKKLDDKVIGGSAHLGRGDHEGTKYTKERKAE
jgi:hypothetical protein